MLGGSLAPGMPTTSIPNWRVAVKMPHELLVIGSRLSLRCEICMQPSVLGEIRPKRKRFSSPLDADEDAASLNGGNALLSHAHERHDRIGAMKAFSALPLHSNWLCRISSRCASCLSCCHCAASIAYTDGVNRSVLSLDGRLEERSFSSLTRASAMS